MKTVTITYCEPCKYLSRAERAREALLEKLDVEVVLVPGKGGVFKVAVNEDVVAKKTNQGFPSEQDIVDAVSSALMA